METKIILRFLTDLAQNNIREWMADHKNEYQEAKSIFIDIVHSLINEISIFDETITGVEPKKCIFRLNRDIRFSKDKRPYKENFGAYITRDGRHSLFSGYYIHLQADNNSMLAGGIYMPPPESLKKIRQEIDYNPKEITQIIQQNRFKEIFGALEGEKLKKAPKGYSPDHPQIELLKYKSFIVVHRMNDESVTKPNYLDYCIEIFREMRPFNEYLNIAVS